MTSRLILLVLLALMAPGVRAQPGRVEIASIGDKDLERTAHRMRIPVEQLRRMRGLLEEATELAKRREPAPEVAGRIAELSVRCDRSAASARLEVLLSRPRTRAREAEDLAGYRRANGAALEILTSLAVLDGDRAVEIARQWPAPPLRSGAAGDEARRDLERRLRRAVSERLTYFDAERAAAEEEAAGDGAESFVVLGDLAVERKRAGRRDEALRIADQALARFEESRGSGGPLGDVIRLVQCLAEIDTPRALRAFEIVARGDFSALPGGRGASTLRRGETTLPLTPNEGLLLNILEGLPMRPELGVRALASVPDLKAKLDAFGGLDGLLGGSLRPPVELIQEGGGGDLDWWNGMRLHAELRGKLASDPEGVGRILAEKSPKTLIVLAQRWAFESPDLAALVLEKAASLATRVEPIDTRAELMVFLIRVTRRIEGEIDPDLLAQGLRTVEELRARDQESMAAAANAAAASGASPRFGMTRADSAEAALLGDYALADFESAMRLVRRLPESRRAAALAQIALWLGNP